MACSRYVHVSFSLIHCYNVVHFLSPWCYSSSDQYQKPIVLYLWLQFFDKICCNDPESGLCSYKMHSQNTTAVEGVKRRTGMVELAYENHFVGSFVLQTTTQTACSISSHHGSPKVPHEFSSPATPELPFDRFEFEWGALVEWGLPRECRFCAAVLLLVALSRAFLPWQYCIYTQKHVSIHRRKNKITSDNTDMACLIGQIVLGWTILRKKKKLKSRSLYSAVMSKIVHQTLAQDKKAINYKIHASEESWFDDKWEWEERVLPYPCTSPNEEQTGQPL